MKTSMRAAAMVTVAMTVLAFAGNGQEETAKSATRSREPIYKEGADARVDIRQALERAGKDNKRVLLQYGANWCGWCYKLHDVFTKNEKIRSLLNAEYELVLVNSDDNKQVAEHYDTQILGVPFLSVLDADGKKLVDQETGSLEIGQYHDPEKVLAFLDRWKVTPLNARTVLKDAKLRAEKEDKLLFVHFGAPWCGWCKRLEALLALDEMGETFGRQYIDVKIDVQRMTNGRDVQADIAPEHGGGIPWYAILDETGRTLATSDGPRGNIGYPVSEEEIGHFIQTIRSTAKRLDPKHLARIEGIVRKRADEIQSERKDPS